MVKKNEWYFNEENQPYVVSYLGQIKYRGRIYDLEMVFFNYNDHINIWIESTDKEICIINKFNGYPKDMVIKAIKLFNEELHPKWIKMSKLSDIIFKVTSLCL